MSYDHRDASLGGLVAPNNIFPSKPYPSCIILLLTQFFDYICDPLNIQWRSYIPFGLAEPPLGWLSHRIGTIAENRPEFVSFEDYYATHVFINENDSRVSFGSIIWKYAFETNNTALADLTTPIAILVMVLLGMSLKLIKSSATRRFSALGRRLGRKTNGMEWEHQNHERMYKFGEYMHRLCFHVLMVVFGIFCSWGQIWWDFFSTDDGNGGSYRGVRSLSVGNPHHKIDPFTTWYYLIQAANCLMLSFNLLEISLDVIIRSPINTISICPATTKTTNMKWTLQFPLRILWKKSNVPGDFTEMFIHHFATAFLIIGSTYIRFHRGGSMVLLVHDITDIFVDLLRTSHFLKWKTSTNVSFTLVFTSWILFRLGIYPFVVLKGVWDYAHLITIVGDVKLEIFNAYAPIFCFAMITIVGLNIFWFYHLIRIAYLIVAKGEQKDLTNGNKTEGCNPGFTVIPKHDESELDDDDGATETMSSLSLVQEKKEK